MVKRPWPKVVDDLDPAVQTRTSPAEVEKLVDLVVGLHLLCRLPLALGEPALLVGHRGIDRDQAANGGGTTFTIRIPIRAPEAMAAAA